MLEARRQEGTAGPIIRLSGSVDENSDFNSLIGGITGQLTVNTKDVKHINSVGVKMWIKYFGRLNKEGVKLIFEECSPAFVEQMNLIPPFVCGGAVKSIYVPFHCESCDAELAGLWEVVVLKKSALAVPDFKCTSCGSMAVFDDIAEEYFSFLARG